MSKLSKLKSQICKPKSYSKQSTVLSCIGAVGVITTVVMAVKATPKALLLIDEEKRCRSKEHFDEDLNEWVGSPISKGELIGLVWKCYIPATLVGLSTIACIFGAATLNKRNQASLVSAYALLNQSYQQYRNAAKTVYGEDADEKIKIETAKNVYVSAGGCHIYDPESESEEILFYDTFCQRYFTSTMSSVINAQYHINRNFALRGWSDINELYNFLGLEEHRGGDLIGWSADEMMESGLTPWVEFENRLVEMNDGLECYLISTLYEPTVLNSDDY